MLYELCITGDSSITVLDTAYQEHMHSISGAYEEALYKHVFPSKVLNLNKDEITILDIGFGLGYTILACFNSAMKLHVNKKITIVSLEMKNDLEALLNSIRFNDERQILYDFIRKSYNGIEHAFNNYYCTVRIGDARKLINDMNNKQFDAVFHDPYSPAKNPELWTVEFFSKIYNLMEDHAILTTYSSSPKIRRAMVEAGFKIGKGPQGGPKREGTLAAKFDLSIPLPSQDYICLFKSRKAIPYRDPSMIDSREMIIARREDEARALVNR